MTKLVKEGQKHIDSEVAQIKVKVDSIENNQSIATQDMSDLKKVLK